MTSIIPVPVLRSSDILVQQRMLGHVQSNQLDLLTLQAQLASGRRVQRPSEDAPASVQGVKLQRLLEQKTQSRRNLESTRSFLSLSESAVSQASDLIIDIRGVVLSMVDTVRTDTEREIVFADVRVASTTSSRGRSHRDRAATA